jgi:hypothetical protein
MMASVMQYIKWPKLKVTLDSVNNTLVIDGISKESLKKAKSSMTITESLVDKDDPDWIFSQNKYITIEIEGDKLLRKLNKKLTEYFVNKERDQFLKDNFPRKTEPFTDKLGAAK